MTDREWRKKLPHRYPMIMLDGVEETSPTGARGWKKVTVNEPHFQGHFPQSPVMPGVLVLEALCQLVWVWSGAKSVRMKGLKKLRFRRPTLPGDHLDLEIEVLERQPNECTVKASASVDGQPAVTAQLTFEMVSH